MAEPTPPAEGFKGAGIGVDQTAIAFRPKNWEELWNFAKLISTTDFVPQSFRGNAGAVLAAVQMGHEVGLPPMSSLRWIAVVKGTPTVWGDGFWSLITNHPKCESFDELEPDEALRVGYGQCTIKRVGIKKPFTRKYTKEMAEKAGLWGGKGATEEKRQYSVWYTNPGRMLQMRARALCGRDAIPEATGGLAVREEVLDGDYIETAATKVEVETPKAIADGTVSKNAKTDPGSTQRDQAEAEAQKKTRSRKAQDKEAEKPAEPEPTAEKSQEEIIKELIFWAENCSDDELTAHPNWLLQNLSRVHGSENQIRVLSPFNNRRQALAKEQKSAD